MWPVFRRQKQEGGARDFHGSHLVLGCSKISSSGFSLSLLLQSPACLLSLLVTQDGVTHECLPSDMLTCCKGTYRISANTL